MKVTQNRFELNFFLFSLLSFSFFRVFLRRKRGESIKKELFSLCNSDWVLPQIRLTPSTNQSQDNDQGNSSDNEIKGKTSGLDLFDWSTSFSSSLQIEAKVERSKEHEEFEETPTWAAVVTVLGYAVLSALGWLRDFLRHVGLEQKKTAHDPNPKVGSTHFASNKHRSVSS